MKKGMQRIEFLDANHWWAIVAGSFQSSPLGRPYGAAGAADTEVLEASRDGAGLGSVELPEKPN